AAGNGSSAFGGAISASDSAGDVTLSGTAAAPIAFTANAVTSGAGGAGGVALGVVAGNGGKGGTGGLAWGGGLSYHIPATSANTASHAVTITSSPFTGNTATAAVGGAGGAAVGTFAGKAGAGDAAQDTRGGGVLVFDEVGT